MRISALATSAALTAFINSRESSVAGPLQDAMREAFPLLLRDFMDSDDARDLTGSYGFTTTVGDEFRAKLFDLARATASAPERTRG